MLRPARRWRRMRCLKRQLPRFEVLDRFGRTPTELFILDLRIPKLLAKPVDLHLHVSMLAVMPSAATLAPGT